MELDWCTHGPGAYGPPRKVPIGSLPLVDELDEDDDDDDVDDDDDDSRSEAWT